MCQLYGRTNMDHPQLTLYISLAMTTIGFILSEFLALNPQMESNGVIQALLLFFPRKTPVEVDDEINTVRRRNTIVHS